MSYAGLRPGLRGLACHSSKDLRGMRNERPTLITPSICFIRHARRTVSTLVCALAAACLTVKNSGMVIPRIVHLILHKWNMHDKMYITEVTMSYGKSFVKRFGSQLAKRDGGWHCVYCGMKLATTGPANSEDRACVDHIKPIAKGGTDDIDNLVLCCRSCNSKKAKRTIYPMRILDPFWSWITARFVKQD